MGYSFPDANAIQSHLSHNPDLKFPRDKGADKTICALAGDILSNKKISDSEMQSAILLIRHRFLAQHQISTSSLDMMMDSLVKDLQKYRR